MSATATPAARAAPATTAGEAMPPDTVSNVVDVIILRLRKKLGHDLITTRRGQGFIIDG